MLLERTIDRELDLEPSRNTSASHGDYKIPVLALFKKVLLPIFSRDQITSIHQSLVEPSGGLDKPSDFSAQDALATMSQNTFDPNGAKLDLLLILKNFLAKFSPKGLKALLKEHQYAGDLLEVPLKQPGAWAKACSVDHLVEHTHDEGGSWFYRFYENTLSERDDITNDSVFLISLQNLRQLVNAAKSNNESYSKRALLGLVASFDDHFNPAANEEDFESANSSPNPRAIEALSDVIENGVKDRSYQKLVSASSLGSLGARAELFLAMFKKYHNELDK
ncbi:MAG: hypothetical protein OXU45_05140, partial [Candidatus Melainabacteria bacterium]|nr:hypothetical protein [Candidatus Melainabacteria bacterium]